MLQQTRVSAVIPYYNRFLSRFPDVLSLAQAPEADLLAHWAGLGYYYRARNLQKAAQQVSLLAQFPNSYEAIRGLPGIGEYTAAAVSSIAFDLPHAVVDGNVYRVLSRVLEDSTNIASSGARRHFTGLAEDLLDRERPGDFNQAVMELGATVCLPKKPLCLVCPVSSLCRSRAAGTQNLLPVKIKPRRSVEEERFLLWIEKAGRVLLWQRPATARLMPGFWELPERGQIESAEETHLAGRFTHGITFHRYQFDVLEATVSEKPEGFEWVSLTDLATLPVSTVLKKARELVKDGALEEIFPGGSAIEHEAG